MSCVWLLAASAESTAGSEHGAAAPQRTASPDASAKSAAPLATCRTPAEVANQGKEALVNGADGAAGGRWLRQQVNGYAENSAMEENDHLVLKVDTCGDRCLRISMVDKNACVNNPFDVLEKSTTKNPLEPVSPTQSPRHTGPGPLIPVRTVSMPGDSWQQNGQVMSTFKPRESKAQSDLQQQQQSPRAQQPGCRRPKVSTVRDKV